MQAVEMKCEPFKDSLELQMIKETLRSCYGSEHLYKIQFSKVNHTDGILQAADLLKCWWLISDMAIVSSRKFSKVPFQVWNLRVKDMIGLLTMREDSNTPILYEQKYEYTDFPEGDFKIYIIDNVMLLPSEY